MIKAEFRKLAELAHGFLEAIIVVGDGNKAAVQRRKIFEPAHEENRAHECLQKNFITLQMRGYWRLLSLRAFEMASLAAELRGSLGPGDRTHSGSPKHSFANKSLPAENI